MNRRTFVGLTALSAAVMLTGCSPKPKVTEVYEAEAGTELPQDAAAYAELPEGIDAGEITLNLDSVDTGTVGSYEASLTYKEEDYAFTVHVSDTIPPEAELSQPYAVVQPGTYAAANYLGTVTDATGTEAGFLAFEKREDLRVMTNEEIRADCLDTVETAVFSEDTEWSETASAAEEGIYDAKIAVKDGGGNLCVLGFTFYVDGTPPVIEGLEDKELETDVFGRADYEPEGITVTDNFDGDLYGNEEQVREDVVLNEEEGADGSAYTHSLKCIDRAGNTAEGQAVIALLPPSEDAIQKAIDEISSIDVNAIAEEMGIQAPATSSSSASSDMGKDAQARAIAQSIADRCTAGSDLERIRQAAGIIYREYVVNGTYTSADPDYRTAYGVFCKGVYTCAGTARAMGMVLECMGYSWTHANPNQWTHQWAIVNMDGQVGWADAMGGLADYGEHPYVNGNSYITPDGYIASWG